MKRTIYYNSQTIEYDLVYKNVKNINIRILPDKSVMVSANRCIDQKTIDLCLMSKAGYIAGCIDRFEHICRQNDTGNDDAGIPYDDRHILFMGRTLPVKKTYSHRSAVIHDGDDVHLYIKYGDKSDGVRLLRQWINEQCKIRMDSIACSVYIQLKKYIGEMPLILYRKMKSRWGSCQINTRRITINKRLAAYDPKLIEFVFFHEFAHLIYPDHSAEFYAFLDRVLPDHRIRKAQLDKM